MDEMKGVSAALKTISMVNRGYILIQFCLRGEGGQQTEHLEMTMEFGACKMQTLVSEAK